ncbi:hypothetical protein AVEN_9935-1 [Araneus ventricosus]|uniref:Uncharacterized protein n=1 Tax=Araneus ventricosus TaxID=182803 RepID=A0A4Y2W204_ARAVE|nr:hypothetical protein AVEN_9935-1 [Araneus ventricosus]
MTPSLNMPGRLRRMAARWLSAFFFFPKSKEHLSGTRFSSNSSKGREHLFWNWLNGQGTLILELAQWAGDTYSGTGSMGKEHLFWNWLNGQGRDFCQAGLNKLVLRSDKCLKGFGDYTEN